MELPTMKSQFLFLRENFLKVSKYDFYGIINPYLYYRYEASFKLKLVGNSLCLCVQCVTLGSVGKLL